MGSWGPPCLPPRLVLQDVQNGFVSKEATRNVYGVVMGFKDKRFDPEDTHSTQEPSDSEAVQKTPRSAANPFIV